jgi:hypothetical protein
MSLNFRVINDVYISINGNTIPITNEYEFIYNDVVYVLYKNQSPRRVHIDGVPTKYVDIVSVEDGQGGTIKPTFNCAIKKEDAIQIIQWGMDLLEMVISADGCILHGTQARGMEIADICEEIKSFAQTRTQSDSKEIECMIAMIAALRSVVKIDVSKALSDTGIKKINMVFGNTYSNALSTIVDFMTMYVSFSPEIIPIVSLSIYPYMIMNIILCLLLSQSILEDGIYFDVMTGVAHRLGCMIVDYITMRWDRDIFQAKNHPKAIQIIDQIKNLCPEVFNIRSPEDGELISRCQNKLQPMLEDFGVKMSPSIFVYNMSKKTGIIWHYDNIRKILLSGKEFDNNDIKPGEVMYDTFITPMANSLKTPGFYDNTTLMSSLYKIIDLTKISGMTPRFDL